MCAECVPSDDRKTPPTCLWKCCMRRSTPDKVLDAMVVASSTTEGGAPSQLNTFTASPSQAWSTRPK